MGGSVLYSTSGGSRENILRTQGECTVGLHDRFSDAIGSEKVRYVLPTKNPLKPLPAHMLRLLYDKHAQSTQLYIYMYIYIFLVSKGTYISSHGYKWHIKENCRYVERYTIIDTKGPFSKSSRVFAYGA